MNHPNNERLHLLLRASGLKWATALTLINRGLKPSVTHTEFSSWLAHPDATQWQPMPQHYLDHAERVLGPMTNGLV